MYIASPVLTTSLGAFSHVSGGCTSICLTLNTQWSHYPSFSSGYFYSHHLLLRLLLCPHLPRL
ncbi:hypothetical protein B296_00050630 [Ensete ventricosum]|uniref:Uncharacterized protein n=1 Tax=Ensete ventricosum TaxID=4639 RepID=A0A426YKH7_ENSVE|nr:hypothetical protein B296_00050630 [Ensete ventricosum]